MNEGYRQWLRKFRLIVGGMNVSNLRCVFNVEKAVDETPNLAEITITNLAVSSISQIGPGDQVLLEAGYENGNFGLIFSGQVVRPYIEKENGTDTNLVLLCQDGDVFINTAFTAKTLSKGSTLDDVVNTCAEGAAKNLISKKISQAQPYIRGKVLFGKSSEYLKRAAYATECQFFVEDDEINIIGAEDYRPGTAVELNPDTGMIGDPTQTDDGVAVKCLLNPSIKLNTLVHVSPQCVRQKRVSDASAEAPELSVDGMYRVVKLTYSGDTHGQDWYCDIDAITQDGVNPAGVASGGSNYAGASGDSSGDSGGGSKSSVLKRLMNGENPWR